MRQAWSTWSTRVRNRLAMHWATSPFRLRNDGPMVSFTFDDVPKSAATTGAQILNEYRARATFYVAGGLVNKWSGHWTGYAPGRHHTVFLADQRRGTPLPDGKTRLAAGAQRA